jgi:hypothetical protein
MEFEEFFNLLRIYFKRGCEILNNQDFEKTLEKYSIAIIRPKVLFRNIVLKAYDELYASSNFIFDEGNSSVYLLPQAGSREYSKFIEKLNEFKPNLLKKELENHSIFDQTYVDGYCFDDLLDIEFRDFLDNAIGYLDIV